MLSKSRLWLLVGAFGFIAQAGSFDVWVLSSMERAGETDAPGSAASANLFCAKGEYKAFQVVIRASPGALTNVNVSASSLISAAGDTIDHSNIALYREYYVYVDRASPDRGGPNYSLGPGWYTDPLIPFNDPLTGAALRGLVFSANPFNVPAGQNQPIWIDIFVPQDAIAGSYSGTINIQADQGTLGVPVELTVWNFALPLQPSLKSIFQFWTPVDINAVEDLLRNKIMPQPVFNNSAEALLIGKFGLNTTNLGFWSGAQQSNCWMRLPPSPAQFDQAAGANSPGLYLVNYTADEIDTCTNLYPVMQSWARNMHAAGVKNLVVMPPVPQLFDDGSGTGKPGVDIWVVLPQGYISSGGLISQALSAHSQIWSYNALSQDGYSPKWLIDFPPIGMRLQAGFLSEVFHLTGLLYWRIDNWNSDPWNQVNNEGVFGLNNYPGEGALVYPGGPAGLDGVVPSIRLKQLRDGIQDYEYVELLKRIGRGEFALETIKTVAPDWIHWTRDPNALESVRQKLGEELNLLMSRPRPQYPRVPAR